MARVRAQTPTRYAVRGWVRCCFRVLPPAPPHQTSGYPPCSGKERSVMSQAPTNTSHSESLYAQDAGCCRCYFAVEKPAPTTHLTPCCDPPPMSRKRLGPSLRHVCASGSHSAATDSIHALPSVAKRCSPHPPSPSAVLTLCVHLPNTLPTIAATFTCHYPGTHTLSTASPPPPLRTAAQCRLVAPASQR